MSTFENWPGFFATFCKVPNSIYFLTHRAQGAMTFCTFWLSPWASCTTSPWHLWQTIESNRYLLLIPNQAVNQSNCPIVWFMTVLGLMGKRSCGLVLTWLKLVAKIHLLQVCMRLLWHLFKWAERPASSTRSSSFCLPLCHFYIC